MGVSEIASESTGLGPVMLLLHHTPLQVWKESDFHLRLRSAEHYPFVLQTFEMECGRIELPFRPLQGRVFPLH